MRIELKRRSIVVTDTTGEREVSACSGGLDAARALIGGDVWDGEWTPRHQEMALGSEARCYLGWAWVEGVLPQWSMHGWNLTGANLYRADLRGAYLYRADLRGAYLYRANLSGALNVPDGVADGGE